MNASAARLGILVVGAMTAGSRLHQRIRAMRTLGHDVSVIDTAPAGRRYDDAPSLARRIRYRLRLPSDETGVNRQLAEAAPGRDLIWVEAAPMIRRAGLAAARRVAPEAPIVWYAEDDMMSRRHRSLWLDRCLPLFDLWVTTKSFNARREEMPSLGARRVLFVENGYDPQIHRPVPADAPARARWGADVSFVGTFERERAESLLHLAEGGIGTRVWGNGWSRMAVRHPLLRIEGRGVYDDDYARVIAASRINLAFLRKANRDLQTTRSAEIPACGGFMLHERNAEITALFAEKREAAYFGSDDELVAECRHWLADDRARAAIAAAGRRRALETGLRHEDILRRILAVALDRSAGDGAR